MPNYEPLSSDSLTLSKQILELGQELINMLLGTREGFEEQGRLLKKIAIRIFRKKAKKPIEEWIQDAENLYPNMEKLVEAIEKENKNEINELNEKISNFIPNLMDLNVYYNNTIQMVKKFFKGDDMNRKVEDLNSCVYRISLLIQAIERLIEKFK